MEVHNRQGDFARARIEKASDELVQANRERLRDLRRQMARYGAERGIQSRIEREAALSRAEEARATAGDIEETGEAGRVERRNSDRLEISEEARALAERTEAQTETRARRLEELRELYETGRLFSSDRLERSAVRLLGSEPSDE